MSWPKISAPLVNMIKEGCENESALLILLIFYFKKPQKSNLSLDNKNLKPPKRFTEKAIKALKPCVDVICYTVYELHKEHVSEIVFKTVLEQPSTVSLI